MYGNKVHIAWRGSVVSQLRLDSYRGLVSKSRFICSEGKAGKTKGR